MATKMCCHEQSELERPTSEQSAPLSANATPYL